MNVKRATALTATGLLALTATAMSLTPISFSLPNQGDLLDQWELVVDLDQQLPSWEIRIRCMATDCRRLLPITTSPIVDRWGNTLSSTRIMLPMTVTVMLPIGGSATWKVTGWSEGRVICQSTGTVQGGPFWESDNEAAAWCTTGPGVRPWAGCLVFDEDADGDVDLKDWALRCSTSPATSTRPQS